MKLNRDSRTGDYWSPDRRYHIERGTIGWNVNEKDRRGMYRYSFSADTLREVRDSLTDPGPDPREGGKT